MRVSGAPVRLTKREFELLRFLVENRNRVLSRDRLLERVWGLDRQVETRSVDVHVGRLRGKLGTPAGRSKRSSAWATGSSKNLTHWTTDRPIGTICNDPNVSCCPWRRSMGRSSRSISSTSRKRSTFSAAASAIGGSVRAKFAPKPATPAYVRYQQPPLWFDGAGVDIPPIDGFRVGFKVFDYGIISLRLTREFHGTWPDLADASDQLVENEALERQAEQACRSVADRLEARR